MNQPKPEYFRPALVAGAVAGLLSGLPLIGAANCLCCLWIVGGAAMASKLLAGQTPGLLKAGDGVLVGALTGIVAAVVDTIVKIPFQSYNMEMARRLLDRFSDSIPKGLEGLLNEAGGNTSTGGLLIGLFITAAVYGVMGALGGAIGVSLFGKKPVPPVASPPPPAQTGGPTDAA